MPTTSPATTRPGADRRIRLFLAAAAAHLGPDRMQDWFFTPHPAARDLVPAVLAWYSDRLLARALRLLASESGDPGPWQQRN